MTEEIKELLEVAKEAALKGGRVLIDNYGKIRNLIDKGKEGFATNVDLEAEKVILDIIRSNFPDHNILSEEAGKNKPSDSEYRWIVDPLDGTHNFIHNTPLFGSSVAVQQGDKIVVGAIYLPFENKLFYAARGWGAFCNDYPIQVSQVSEISDAWFVHDSSVKRSPEEYMASMKQVGSKTLGVRLLGVAVNSLMAIANGNADIYLKHHTHLWDEAAGIVIIEEAGGKITDFEGNPLVLKDEMSLIATNGLLHEKVLNMLKEK